MHHQNNLHKKFIAYPNLGLFYFKFTPKFSKDDTEAKKRYLADFNQLNYSSGKLEKRIDILKNFAGSENSILMKNESRFLCGVGYVNNVEWGLSFDWTTGIPYLPGSSFKGALLSYLEFRRDDPEPVECWNDNDFVEMEDGQQWDKKTILEVFGSQETLDRDNKCLTKEKKVGSVIFLDVYPQNFKGFEVDVITPHYTKYYENPQEYPPADIYNPVPTHFLTIKPGSKFLFMFKFRNNGNQTLGEKIKSLIVETGENYGFGAKTSSGYGYFKRTQK